MEQLVMLPQEQLRPDEFDELPIDERGRYTERYILKMLELNRQGGLTLTDIAKNTYIGKPTISKYLELLVAKRKAYKIKKQRAIIYFPNGRPIHPVTEKNLVIDNNQYLFYLLENPEGLFLYIQEKSKGVYGFEETKGGIMVPFTGVESFSNVLAQIKDSKGQLIEDYTKKLAEGLMNGSSK